MIKFVIDFTKRLFSFKRIVSEIFQILTIRIWAKWQKSTITILEYFIIKTSF